MTHFGELVNQCLLSFSYFLDKKLPKWAAAIKEGCNKRKGGELSETFNAVMSSCSTTCTHEVGHRMCRKREEGHGGIVSYFQHVHPSRTAHNHFNFIYIQK